MKSGFDYSEFKKYVTKYTNATKEFNIWLKTFLLQQAQRCIARTKQRQNALDLIDTGFMINAWLVGDETKVLSKGADGKYISNYKSAADEATIDSVKQVGNTLEITVGNIAEYASYVEFGHTTRGGGRWINGGFMLTVSMDEIERAMPARFDTAFTEFLRKWGID